ncbi:MAG: lysophospholipase [Rhodobacterales bacterium 32-66-7]|nr:MAG: lysophospholipase [Rhodobacterales bacterium 12-65-15]OYX24290.1 MAG: lysophospholipase [Rhodobacterales bacterium 32-66-7]
MDSAGREAPFHETLAESPAGVQSRWVTAGKTRLRVAFWRRGTNGTVFLLPGRTEAIEKYGRAIGDLVTRGWSVISIDWRGQGLSDRALPDRMAGHVGDFAEYQEDIDAMLAEAGRARLPEPWVMLAHSMGGCIGLRALMRGVPFKAAAFSSPMWGISMTSWQRGLAQVVTSLASTFGLGTRYAPTTGPQSYLCQVPFEGNVLTSDREMWGYMRAQVVAEPELGLGGPSLAWLGAALRECGALSGLAAPQTPTICALGTMEKVVDVPSIHLRMAAWSNGELDLYPGAEHEILMEGPATRRRFMERATVLFDANRG